MAGIKVTDKCPHCDLSITSLSGQRIPMLIVGYEIDKLEALFKRRLDFLECAACKRCTGVKPTVLFLEQYPLACFMVVGTLAPLYCGDVIKNTRAYCQSLSPDLEPHILPSMDALRDVVRNKLRNTIDHLLQVLMKPYKNSQIEELAQLGARHFAAVTVALEVPQAHINIRAEDPQLEGKVFIDNIARCQAGSWIALWHYRRQAHNSTTNLDDQLSWRFYESVIIPGAADYALETLAKIEQSELSMSFPEIYCLQALRASICALAERDNPQSDDWTIMFFWAEMALRLGNDDSKTLVKPLIISEQRTRTTIRYQDAAEEIAKIVTRRVPTQETFDALDEIAFKLGYPELPVEVVAKANITASKSFTAEDITKLMHTTLDDLGPNPRLLITILQHSTKGLIDSGLIDELEWLAEEAIALMPNSLQVRADVYAWLGGVLKTLRAPQRFLDRISATVQDWEHLLAPSQQASIWVERSNALRMVGRAHEALSTIEDVLKNIHEQEDGEDYCSVRLNHAILLRETGAPDLSVTKLEALLSLPTVKGGLRISVLDSLAIAYYQMGRTGDMVNCYEKRLLLAVGPFSDQATASRVSLAASLVADDRYDDAIVLLTELDPHIGSDSNVLISAASAWLTILSNSSVVPKRAFNRDALKVGLSQLVKRAKEEGNIQDWLNALRILGGFAELSGNRKRALVVWESVAKICGKYDQSLSPVELLHLARYAYLNNNNNLARNYLLQLPRAIITHGGQVTDIAAVALSLEPIIRRGLDEIVSIAWDKANHFDEIRLIAEMRRDLVGRAQRYLRGNLSDLELLMLEEGISDEVLAELTPTHGRVGVLEWIDCSEWIACFVTVIDSSGKVSSHMLEYPEIDLARLSEKMDTSLRAWYQARQGDPFDNPQWCELEAWLFRELTPYLKEGDHLVIFENEGYAGLPWHVAAAVYWSCSYAGGWASLLTLQGSAELKPATKSIGVAVVPYSRESDEVLTSFHQSLARTKALAEQLGLELIAYEGKECDSEKLINLLAQVDVCKLLCHGGIRVFGHEVNLMLAHDGDLPPADPLAAASDVACKHRFGWRDGRQIGVSSPILFSAACSTGLSHVVGVGERVGLLTGLSNAGARTLVAPRWDAVATSVLPILDDALQRYLGGMTLAAAVRAACQKAHEYGPRWLAWTLCIEGDWR